MKPDKNNSDSLNFEWLQHRFQDIDPGFVLNQAHFTRLRNYIDLFIAWNDRYSFSRYSSEQDIIRHLILPSFCHGSVIPQSGTLVDLGSGAGFPGTVISILKPELDVTCLDSSESASEFLAEYQRQFPGSNLAILNGRADELAHEQDHRENFDIVVARAFAPLPIVLEIAAGFVKPLGRITLQVPEKEHADIEQHIMDIRSLSLVKTRTWSLNIPTADKNEKSTNIRFCEFKKTHPVDDRYPRTWNALKKRPLWLPDTESD